MNSVVYAEEYNINPGMWETTSKMDVTGVPPELAAMMKKAPKVEKECVKTKSYDFDPGKQTQGCTIKSKKHSNNKLSWEMSCDSQGSQATGKGEVNFKGDTASGWIEIDMPSGPAGPMKMKHTFEGKRLGAC